MLLACEKFMSLRKSTIYDATATEGGSPVARL